MSQFYTAKEDIRSHFKDKGGKENHLYASKGEKLELINRRGTILILKGKKETFPCHESKVA